MATPRLTRKDLEERQKKFVEGLAVFEQAFEAYERGRKHTIQTNRPSDWAEGHELCAKAAELLRASKQRDPVYVSTQLLFIFIKTPK
jgi:hypothetical protein